MILTIRKIKNKIWDRSSAQEYIQKVNRGRAKFGLTYLSACDYLGLNPNNAATMKGMI
ncbi:hypothetical protein [Caproiciproducens sp. NJN-50]|uniref:hypothetical protein n=1 Tax=Caproiciproducens sp. NJN-50 TaxID=2507162 RepID=UPI0013E8D653|nr:hypothetical protein [Caproiciproducens sp. NJN-50]